MKILVQRFDIDKLFVARYALDKKGKKIQFESKEEYENRLRKLGFADEDIARMSYSRYNVNELQQSREAYQNMLLDMCIASISNPLQYAESKQPLDAVTSYLTGKILKDIDNLSGNVEENVADQIYYASPSFQNKTKDDLISGKSHLGVFALAASHHSLSQMVGLTFNRSEHLDKYPIFSLSKINSNTPNYWDKDASIYTLVSDWISAMINAHVDVAKDPYINRLNIRTLTLQMTSLLLRSGVGEPTFYFLAQPILVEAAKEFEKVSGYYGAEKISRRELLNRIKDKYYNKIQELGGNVSQVRSDLMRPLPSSYTTTKLFNINYLRGIMPKKESAEWYIDQLYILKAFEELQPFAQALSELTTISQIDTKKYGNNFALQQQFLMKLADFLLKNQAIANPENIFRDTFLKEKLRVALISPRNIFSNSLVRVTRDFENRRAKIYSLIAGLGSESLNDSLVNSVTRAMESNYKLNAITSYARNNGIRARDLMYGENSIARRLVKIKRLIQSGEFPELLRSDGRFENALLDNIDPMLKTAPVDFVLPDFIVYKQNKSADGNIDDQIIRAWEELLDFDTEVESKKENAKEIRKFARDLAVYAMYTSGDAFGKNNIFKFVPNSFRETSGYFDSIRGVESDISSYLQNLDDNNTIRNLWWNDDVVPIISLYQTTYDEMGVPERTIREGVGAGYSIGNTPVLGLITLDRNEAKFLYKNSSNQPIYQLYIKINYGERNDPRTTKLYKFAGLQKETIQRGDSTYENFKPIYKLVTKKGLNFKGKTFVENIGTENSPSVITINNENFEIDLPTLGIEPVINYNPQSEKSFDPISVINEYIFDDGKADLENKATPATSTESTEEPSSNETINIYAGTGENADLSNLAIRPFTHLGIQFQSVEQAFQFYKTEFSPKDEHNRAVGQAIMMSTKGSDLRRLGRQFKGLDSKAWDQMSSTIMKQLILDSFEQNPEALQRLLSTGNATLTHTQDKGKWGTEFPRILMEVRDELKPVEGSAETTFQPTGESSQTANQTPEVTTEASLQDSVSKVEPSRTSNKNSYTFSDGFTVYIPFALNDQQIHVLQELDKFVNDRVSQSITLSGYAGTGKTTIISIFHKYLSYLGNEPLYLAPTHRANAVTKQMNPDADVNTLHSFLGLSPSMDLDSEDFDVSIIKFEQTQFSEVEDKLLIIDESSMISDDLYEFLQKSAARGGNKIIYVGDPAQLKPVKGTDISKVFKDPNGIQLGLTKVERTGDNAILAEATRVRNGQDLTYNTSLNSKGEGVIYTQDRSEVKEYITNNINSVEYASDPLYFKILSATNKEVPIYNDLVRKILFGDKAKRTPFVEGDLLMAYSNEMRQRSFGRDSKSKKYLINNSLDYQVVRVKEIKSKSLPNSDIVVDGYQLRLKDLFRGGEFDIFMLDPNTSQPIIDSIVNHIDELWAEWVKARSRGDVRFAAQIISEINKFKDSFTTIAPLYNSRGAMKKNKTFDYGYAHTIHKSQGGTYNKVLVLGGTINAFSHDPQAQQQLKYVAITRAKEQVMYTAPMTVQINTNPTVTSTNNTVNNEFSELDKAGEKRINECK